MWFVEEAVYGGGDHVRVVRMEEILSLDPVYTDFEVQVHPYQFTPSAAQPGGIFTTNDSRISNADARDGRLVAAHAVGFEGEATVRWYEFDVAGLPTTHSCKALADHVAPGDAPLVTRLRQAGFLVLGKTNVPEFCTSVTTSELNGTCRNPWDPERSPAGSSGGAAVSVAGGLCAVAHGTDGAGSVRVPAAYCGLVGTKPTRGRVSWRRRRRSRWA